MSLFNRSHPVRPKASFDCVLAVFDSEGDRVESVATRVDVFDCGITIVHHKALAGCAYVVTSSVEIDPVGGLPL